VLTAADFDPPIAYETGLLQRNTKVKGEHALLEWKVYETTPQNGLTQRQYDRLVGSSMHYLAKLLSQEPKLATLRALECVGFYELPDPDLNPLVCFAFRPPPDTFSEPVSLAALLQDRVKFNHDRMVVDPYFFVGQRFVLALTLSSAIYQLHYLGWLHKGIRSHNILFYRPSNQHQHWKPDPKQLFLAGYEFARPTSAARLSVKLESTSQGVWYQHPTYMGSSIVEYQPSFDLYNLGIVLVEIALLMQAQKLAEVSKIEASRPDIPLGMKWKRYVMEYLLSAVNEKMGEVYGEVVRRCIEGRIRGGGSGAEVDYREYLKNLDEEVFAKLELCFA
jgi:hypothetical protein